MAKAKPFRWRTVRLTWGRTQQELWRGETCYAIVAPRDKTGGYYWYTWNAQLPEYNGCASRDPIYNKGEAQTRALAYVRKHLQGENHGKEVDRGQTGGAPSADSR